MKKILVRTLLGLLFAVVALAAYIQISWGMKKFDAPYPDIHASTDSAVIARGKYLAFVPAHCANCHVPFDKIRDVEKGEPIPLIGGWEITLPIGVFRAANITPDLETGIGKRTDGELARTLRHSVSHDGKLVIEIMPFQNMSDEDLTAVISFLRSQPAVRHEVARTEFNFLGKAVGVLTGMQPVQPVAPPPARVPKDTTAEYGKYLVNSIANCRGCHTERDLMTGAYIGADCSGGFYFEPDAFSEGYSYRSPNLTADPKTGVMTAWTEADFIKRIKGGRVHRGSPMPWGSNARMDTSDLKAIYRYLRSLPPVENSIGQTVFEPGEKPAAKK